MLAGTSRVAGRTRFIARWEGKTRKLKDSIIDIDRGAEPGTAVTAAGEVLVAFDARSASERLTSVGVRLAAGTDLGLTVLLVETPGALHMADPLDVLTHAAEQGAAIARVPAASMAEGAAAYAALSPVRHVVLPRVSSSKRRTALWPGAEASPVPAFYGADLTLVTVDGSASGGPGIEPGGAANANAVRDYAIAVAATLAIVPVLLLLKHWLGEQGLGFLFVFPVLGVAARLGFRPALLSVVGATILYDLLVLGPAYGARLAVAQNLIVASALLIVAAYASSLTSRLRDRAALSDRSAQENAALAAFGGSLARASDWESTGSLLCAEVSRMFGVYAALFRERDGDLALVAAEPSTAAFGPVDHTALRWAWQEGQEAGTGASVASAADWQFHPLRTSLGTLAVLAVGREDGRAPIPPGRRVLFMTLLAQAALAHERLRLEDRMRAAVGRAEDGLDPAEPDRSGRVA